MKTDLGVFKPTTGVRFNVYTVSSEFTLKWKTNKQFLDNFQKLITGVEAIKKTDSMTIATVS